MQFSDILKEEWPHRLISSLTGRVLNDFNRSVSEDCANDYEKLKEALLNALGLSKERCNREFLSFQRKHGDNCQDVVRQLKAMAAKVVRQYSLCNGKISNILSDGRSGTRPIEEARIDEYRTSFDSYKLVGRVL